MYLKILSNDDSWDWGGHLRPEKVTVGKIYEVLRTHKTTSGHMAYEIHPDNDVFGTWWVHEEDDHGHNMRHHFIIFDKLTVYAKIIGV